MDHVILPLGVVSKVFMYPGRVDYIAIPFLQYPVTSGKGIYLQAQHGASSRFSDLWSSDDCKDETEFFATWLFCGLIQEVLAFIPQQLGEASLYRHEDFVCHRRDHHGQEIQATLCTEQLVLRLEQWSMLMNRHKHRFKRQHDHLKLCMDVTYTLLSWKSVKMEQHVKIIIAATAELLSLAINSFCHDADLLSRDSKCPEAWAFYVEDAELQSSLIANGWCPSDVDNSSSGNWPFSQTLLFASHLIREERTGFYKSCPSYNSSSSSTQSKQHARCTSKGCQALGGSINPQKPRTGCTCKMFQFSEIHRDKLLKIVDDGIALLQIHKDPSGTYTMDIIPYKDDAKFVAISHVWSDGLGNSEQNSVLQCRLDHVFEALSRSWKDAMGEEAAEILFWLDTICCPLTPTEARMKVLRTMRSIYEKAEYVLVLDGELINIATNDMADLEIGWRILESGWMSRLWTLQEGYLAKDLWVLFKDRTFRLDSLKDFESRLSPLNQRHLWSHFKYLYWSLRKSWAKQDTIGDQIWGLFWAAVRKRRVTKSTDEPLCLGTFFDLNIGAIIDAGPEDQMRMFWHLIGESDIEIPSGIVFSEHPRLDVDGYRWAPATFLNGSVTDTGLLGSGAAKLTANGLILKLEALSVSQTSLSKAYIKRSESTLMKMAIQLQMKAMCYVRDQDGVWYSLIPREVIENTAQHYVHTSTGDKDREITSSLNDSFTTKMLPDPSIRYVILRQKSTDLALLAWMRENINGRNVVIPFRRVVLVKDVSFQTPVFELSRTEAHSIAQSSGFDTLDETGLTKAVEAGANDAALRLDRQGITLPASFDEQKKFVLMATNIIFMLTDQHHLDAVAFPEDTEWCIA